VKPATRPRFWEKKLAENKARDTRNRRKLKELGWQVLVVWECHTRRPEQMIERVVRFLES